MENYINTLNEFQKQAVLETQGPVLVIAGAGSGKTRVLTARICHLIDMGIEPFNILAITFTNKAASEMRERISQINPMGAYTWTSTFHSLSAKILRQHADRLGYDQNFSIYSDLESNRVIKRICADYPDSDPKKIKIYSWHISNAKTYDMTPEVYYESIKQSVEQASIITNVYKMYVKELKSSNSMDFDDLLINLVRLFENCADVLEKYQDRFKYVNVDEFQDTNTLQYKMIKLLVAKHNNLFVVGDEDQNIYSWRGAEIRNILDFNKEFKDAKVFKLEQNYRSTTSILNAANNVIKNNSNRNAKNLWSDISEEDSVEYFEAQTDRDEASFIGRKINYLLTTGFEYKDIAILVRANALSRLFEEEFALHGMPYRVFGGFRFFERKEIKDILSYIKLAINPFDTDSFFRAVNNPKRGIGEKAVEKFMEIATENNFSIIECLNHSELFSTALAKKLDVFKNIMNSITEAVSTMTAPDFIAHTILASGFDTYFKSTGEKDDLNRLENANEMVNAVAMFVNDNPDSSIADFVQSISLMSDADEMDNDNYITIATIHAVKGLEFGAVFIVGLEEGVFPTSRALNDGDIEEERRLMYVAITRAKKNLFAVFARSRYRFGEVCNFPKSRFIIEMRDGKDFIKLRQKQEGQSQFLNSTIKGSFGIKESGFAENYSPQTGKSNFNQTNYNAPGTDSAYSSKPRDGKDYSKFNKDTVVEHTKFGRGIIIDIVGNDDSKSASIAFKGLGVKRFSLAVAYNSLTIIE